LIAAHLLIWPKYGDNKYIHCQEERPTLNWAQRFQVIKDITTGLLYLLEKWEKVVIHRDIKASNVLLDDEMNGRLALVENRASVPVGFGLQSRLRNRD
jgi:serine/threonine protein kinase